MVKRQSPISKLYLFIKNFALGFLICFYFKKLVVSILSSGISFKNDIIEFSLARNTGAAFSLFKDANFILAGIAVVAIAIILCYFLYELKRIKILETYALSCLMAGILSNTLERFMDGYVTDYFKLVFIDFPIFNMADVYITIGAGLLVVGILLLKRGRNA